MIVTIQLLKTTCERVHVILILTLLCGPPSVYSDISHAAGTEDH